MSRHCFLNLTYCDLVFLSTDTIFKHNNYTLYDILIFQWRYFKL
ncbi:hypothetical protein PROPEN_04900 [Proteus penneri ATCC 35198]|nr:hypothetical protein PROPEN_04900 [Proteus penneri ATCC 35198]